MANQHLEGKSNYFQGDKKKKSKEMPFSSIGWERKKCLPKQSLGKVLKKTELSSITLRMSNGRCRCTMHFRDQFGSIN